MNENGRQEKLAKLVSRIHGRTLNPFWASDGMAYIWDEQSNAEVLREESCYSWDMLPEKSEVPNRVDRQLFRGIARYILKDLDSISKDSERVERVAQIVHAILTYTLTPFYSEKYAELVKASGDFRHWGELEECSDNPNDLDKQFCRAVAIYMLTEIGMYKRFASE